jgi:predicted ATP-grasp superfamily ATP-dependent carboligase
MAEFKRDDRTGQHLLLELNPRFWGSLSLPIKAGVDFPDLLCRMAMGEEVDPVTTYRLGVQGRTLLPGDLLHILRARRRDWRGFFSLAGRSVHFDFCSMDDPVPGAARVASVIPALGGRLWR